ncbi:MULTISPECIES: D-ribose pyranase [Carnobacterium]|uniref:D-ribose pyranase n=1 Tax=Carnobacterium inhibens subsp. gilichinskyi TaxID=1266845 RepID=U5S9F8_9LACT|nr:MULTISPECIES: D-ribose pyranase [Carnobacterium]AGY81924.1 ribose pyranase [Carnobacterium inhibens subsp. gilichinskyi]MCM3511336.1 D-ribose pyranase [Carnobacterium inhibens]MDN5372960.1 D-ribose pyranase [Carnobacterium sp.]
MKKHGILNSEIAKVLTDLGHTDKIAIGDAGLPVPDGVKKIDLALTLSEPAFISVLQVVLSDMKVEAVVLAEEIKEQNAGQLAAVKAELTENERISYVSHEEFKEQLKDVKAVIRTGEATPYSNIILQSGVLF